MADTLRWGIIGPGAIARDFRDGVAASRTGRIAAIATREPGRPGLAEAFPGARIHAGYQAILEDPEVDALYIATPHPSHAEWAIKAAEAGKHVLIEKPMALSAFEADAIFNAHLRAGTFAGEAFMYRLHPATRALGELVAAGAVGEVRMIQSSFGFQMPKFDAAHRLFANDLAGGGILDVGGYPVSMARFIAGRAVGKAFLDPVTVRGTAHLGQQGTDEWAAAVLQFESGAIAQVSCAIFVGLDNILRIHGATGRIEMADFWFAGGNRGGGAGTIRVIRPDGSVEAHEPGLGQPHLYAFEADAVADAVAAGRQQFASPGMDWADSLGNARALDGWRAGAGLEYEIEKPARRTLTLKGTTPGRTGTAIPKRAIPGLGKPASVVALGFEDFRTFASAAILLDGFFEAGGNIFDTAWVYGGRPGLTEELFGDWHTSRGVTDEVVVIGKGAHSPLCYPEIIGRQLDDSLNRLKRPYVDIYFLHRDNPDIPVGEFVDALDAEVKKGRIRGLFGGSNWTRERFAEARGYARRTGKAVPNSLSNNMALAKMIKPIWPGCVAASDDDFRAWLTAEQLPNFSWSSQARGFFTDRPPTEEVVSTWYSDENLARRDRALALAAELGASPIHIALAYVLAQPFPSIPLIGPRRLQELDNSVKALSIRLTPEQVAWLEQG